MIKLKLHFQIAEAAADTAIPTKRQFKQWLLSALESALNQPHTTKPSLLTTLNGKDLNLEISIRLIDREESAHLNKQYRGKSGPTNVLSFPYDEDFLPGQVFYLGDLGICVPLVLEEAQQQHKLGVEHWAHLTVHGALHLLGYDHEQEEEALLMEGLETQIMRDLGFADPY